VPVLALDTAPEAERVQIEILRAMTGEQRVRIAFELTALAIRACECGIRDRHPEYGEREVFLARVRLTLGDELFRAAYAGEPALEP